MKKVAIIFEAFEQFTSGKTLACFNKTKTHKRLSCRIWETRGFNYLKKNGGLYESKGRCEQIQSTNQ